MEIKERIKQIKDYFKEMQIVPVDDKQVIYVTVEFPHGWIIDNSLEEKYNITIERGNYPTEYFFFADIDTGETVIFDAIEENINKMKNAIERAQLLKVKVAELTKLFQDDNISLEELRGLKFEWSENINLIQTTVIDTLKEPIKNETFQETIECEKENTTINKKSKKHN